MGHGAEPSTDLAVTLMNEWPHLHCPSPAPRIMGEMPTVTFADMEWPGFRRECAAGVIEREWS